MCFRCARCRSYYATVLEKLLRTNVFKHFRKAVGNGVLCGFAVEILQGLTNIQCAVFILRMCRSAKVL
jgi:hypothetical protein